MLAKATMSSSSTSISNEHKRDWLDLPSDVTANILQRIGVVDILENAQKVCTAWRKICKDPAMWKVINLFDLMNSEAPIFINKMCEHAVDRSQGQLVDITMVSFYASGLLPCVANRSRQLKRLEIAFGNGDTCERLPGALMKFPLLEELNLYSVFISKEAIEVVGRYCPLLKTLKMNKAATKSFVGDSDELAMAIGKTLHGLTHLELIGNNISNIGLQAILDGCLYLETLDLRKCLRIDLNGDLGKRCFKQVKHLKLPNDSLGDCPYVNYHSLTYNDLHWTIYSRHMTLLLAHISRAQDLRVYNNGNGDDAE